MAFFDDEEFRVELTANSETASTRPERSNSTPPPQTAQSRAGPQMMSLSSEPKYTKEDVLVWFGCLIRPIWTTTP